MDGKRSPALLVLDIIFGLIMIVCALVFHLTLPGIPFALLLLGGILLLVTGILYR